MASMAHLPTDLLAAIFARLDTQNRWASLKPFERLVYEPDGRSHPLPAHSAAPLPALLLILCSLS